MIKPKIHPSWWALALFAAVWMIYALISGINKTGRNTGDFPMIQQAGVLYVCVEEDLFNYYSDEKGAHGFQYELITAFAQRHKLKLNVLVAKNLEQQMELLQKDACDIVLGPLPITTDFQKSIHYTRPIMDSRFVVVQRKNTKLRPNSPIRNTLDFGGKVIYTSNNRAQTSRIHHLANEISDTINHRVLERASSERLVAMVASGRIDFAVCDWYVAKSFRERYPNVDVETPIGFHQEQAWAVKLDRQLLLDSLNAFIIDFKQSKEVETLLKNHQ